MAERQPASLLAALPAAPDAEADIAAIQALSDVHFREAAIGSNVVEEVSDGRAHGARQPAAGGDTSVSVGFNNLVDGLLGGRRGSAGADGGVAATLPSGDYMAAKTAAQAQNEPQLMVALLRLCADWLRAPAEPEQGITAGPAGSPGAGAVCTALTALCAWAEGSAEPAGHAEQHVVDAMLELAQTVAAAYAACGGAEPEKAHALSLGGSDVSDEPEQVMVVDLVQRLAGTSWSDPAHSDFCANSHSIAVRAALISGLLRPLASLPPLRDVTAPLQHSDGARAATPAAAAAGVGSLLAPDGSLNWAVARAAADLLDVRAAYAGLGAFFDSSCGSQQSPAAVPQAFIPLVESVDLESLLAAMIVAASQCAVRPVGTVTACESTDDDAKPVASAEKADDAASDSLLGALFADDPDDGVVDDDAGTGQFCLPLPSVDLTPCNALCSDHK